MATHSSTSKSAHAKAAAKPPPPPPVSHVPAGAPLSAGGQADGSSQPARPNVLRNGWLNKTVALAGAVKFQDADKCFEMIERLGGMTEPSGCMFSWCRVFRALGLHVSSLRAAWMLVLIPEGSLPKITPSRPAWPLTWRCWPKMGWTLPTTTRPCFKPQL